MEAGNRTSGDGDAAATEPSEPERAPRSRPARRRGWWAAFLAAFVVVVAVCEVAVRAANDRLPEPRHYYSGFAQTSVHDLTVLSQRGIRSDLTFVGTSMVRRDVEPNRLEVDTPGPGVKLESVRYAHNVALPGAQTTVVQRWMLDEVVPRIRPKRVVWGISTLDFNAGRPDFPIDQYEAARATKTGFYAEADRVLWNSAVSDHRDTLRDPYALIESLRYPPPRLSLDRPLDERATWPLGFKKRDAEGLARMRRAHLETIKNRQLRNFRIGTKEFAAYRDTIAAMRRDGIEVAVVIMPVTDGYLDAHPKGRDQYFAWKDVVTREAQRQGVPVIDMWDAVSDRSGFSAFRDYQHLSPPAARQFTDDLATQLKELGW